MKLRRTVWVTGATSGIGRACVWALAHRGHRVIALGRRTERLNQLRSNLPNGSVHTVTCDVQNHEAVAQAFASLPEPFAHVDSLVNNAGLMLGFGRFDTVTPQQMHTMVMTNCMGVLHNTSVLLPSLKASKSGHVINVTSVAAFYPYVTGHVYAATKAFVEHFGANLRTELVTDGIRVTNIAPGRTDTEFDTVRADATVPRPDHQTAPVLQAEEVANAVIWALDQPAHASVHAIEMMPAHQALSFR